MHGSVGCQQLLRGFTCGGGAHTDVNSDGLHWRCRAHLPGVECQCSEIASGLHGDAVLRRARDFSAAHHQRAADVGQAVAGSVSGSGAVDSISLRSFQLVRPRPTAELRIRLRLVRRCIHGCARSIQRLINQLDTASWTQVIRIYD